MSTLNYIATRADDEKVGRLGYYLPWSVVSATLSAIAAGLVSTFVPTSSTGTWVGYSLLAGIARGCGAQMVCSSKFVVIIANRSPAARSCYAVPPETRAEFDRYVGLSFLPDVRCRIIPCLCAD